jgi:pilus assembly protein Flp/PilA
MTITGPTVIGGKAQPREKGRYPMLQNYLRALLKSDRGASMAEYGLLVVLIAIVALAAVSLAGDQVSGTYSEIGSSVAGV